MTNRYLVEVQKPAMDWAIAGCRHGKTMADVLQEIEPQLGPMDRVRISLLSVALIAVRDLSSPMGWKADPVTEGTLK